MGLEKQFNELNMLAGDIKAILYNIYVSYLKKKYEFPYETVYTIIDKYELAYQRAYKKKYSKINEILNNFDEKKRSKWEKLNAPSREEIIAHVCEKIVPSILENAPRYLPVDQNSKMAISNKLFPIVKDLKLSSIIGMYNEFKKYIVDNGEKVSFETSVYLQQMFVGFIMAKLSHNPMNKYSRSRMCYTYEEVCESMLDESALFLEEIKSKGK